MNLTEKELATPVRFISANRGKLELYGQVDLNSPIGTKRSPLLVSSNANEIAQFLLKTGITEFYLLSSMYDAMEHGFLGEHSPCSLLEAAEDIMEESASKL